MKHTSAIFTFLLCTALLLGGCNHHSDGKTDDTTDNVIDSGEISADESDDETKETESEIKRITLPDDFVFPITDGSTSTTNLDNAVRSAILGGEQKTAHTKTSEEVIQ